jgi:peptide/nickel transport system permease protein
MSLLAAEARSAATARPVSPARLFWRRFRRHPGALLAGGVLLAMGIAALAAPLIAGWSGVDPEAVDLLALTQPPGAGHPLGTDELGRDVLVRLLYGGRVSLFIGLAAAVVSAIIGTAIGVIAGYRGGWLDALLMRLTDGIIALPLLPLLIVLAALDLTKLGLSPETANAEGTSLIRIVIIVSLFGWTTAARLVRGATLSLKQQDFVRAATALGVPARRIMWRHIVPNALSPVIVATTLSVGNIILFESVLSFLGLGVQAPLASWGNMLTNAQELIWNAPWLAFWPGLAIFVTVIAFNFLGDGLQDALDPRALTRRGD